MTMSEIACKYVRASVALLALLTAPVVCTAQIPEQTASDTTPPVETKDDSTGAAEPEIRPRLELYVSSARTLITEAKRSHSGVFVERFGNMALELAGASSEGVDAEQATAIVEQIKHWPDTAIRAATYAPDTEGRLRWAIRFDWPLQDLHNRVQSLLTLEAAGELLEGVELKPAAKDAYEITLGESTLGYLLPVGEGHSCLASHDELPFPAEPFTGTAETERDGASLIACRLNLTGTERDSGATFLSSFSAVTDIVYAGRVNEDGDWTEAFHVHWPPISGMGAKALFGKVKQTFFVPDSAFGAMVFKAIMGPGMLEGMAGFGPQVMMEAPGEMTMVGTAGPGPIVLSIESDICVTMLPGTGFLPMPDIIVQARTKRPKKLMDGLREAAEKVNALHHDREQSEPWHETTVRDHTVLWSDGANRYPGVMMPLVMRPVLFTTTEVDARERERDFLVLGWTSTSPEALVRRWLDLPRSEGKRHLPTKRKTNSQLWVNWRQVYKWVSPYVNVPWGSLTGDALLPHVEEVASSMTDALITARTRYAGLSVSHTGPIPVGTLVVPALVSASTAADVGSGSDLARERLACQRLKVLYHHAKLFREDMGRWPAEVAELDGYVDFDGHPELLELQLSSRKRWGEWFEGIFEMDDEEEEGAEEEEEEGGLDDHPYVIEWSRDAWRLGLAPGTLEHLEAFYIDQDGRIHRGEKKQERGNDETSERDERGEGAVVASVLRQAARNVERRYLPTREASESQKE